MAEKTVDARGLSCPEPVLLSKAAIEGVGGGTVIKVLVDTVTSRENVTRMAQTLSCTVLPGITGEAKEADGGGYVLNIKKG